ncbi:cytochrome c oxidase, subunit VIb [Scenedesmus sp. NREL 46B-D3]|nr:cytochrome c oxidase, subunit VIb [Scenedesmus sp. NREL 46B-D3]
MLFFVKARADSEEQETAPFEPAPAPPVELVVEEVAPKIPAAVQASGAAQDFVVLENSPEPAPEPEPEPPKIMGKPTDADIEAAKQELVQDILAKLEEIDGAIVPEVVTAPYDPRFPTTNQNRHCFIRYNEYYKCKFERGEDDKRCLFYQRAYKSMCPPDWVEEWEDLREQGLWFGKY